MNWSLVVRGRRLTPVDIAMALLFTALGVAVMVIGITDPAEDAPVQAAVLVVLATAPLVLWRADPTLAAGLVLAGLVVFVVGAPGTIRCGIMIPVTFVLAVAAGAKLGPRRSLVALALLMGILAVTAASEPEIGAPPEVFPFVAAVVLALWGAGLLLHSRSRLIDALRQRREEVRRAKERNAAAQVQMQRTRIAADLDGTLAGRLGELAAVAEGAASANAVTRAAALREIEERSRRTLDEMRDVVGALREDAGEPPRS